MSFTTLQAGKALCLTPNNMRKYRHDHQLGKKMGMGNLVQWDIFDLRRIQEIQGARWKLPKYAVEFSVLQLEDEPINGSMRIWAIDEETARSKAMAWFWNALLKEEPANWGLPAGFETLTIKEVVAPVHKIKEEDDTIITFDNL